ncbi:hypothetical protein PR202_ga19261 [Eleusine coracana subsp. coracana]|uniref:Uncharacterized protein n=1 Tax=Eleusine coracana subsp. coracana TaxID=191504 RepID=A0AAV5CV53_ELECO|nr:hypothetical protein PR202_ga19261 [Eleusine coracana subsp. coracana]
MASPSETSSWSLAEACNRSCGSGSFLRRLSRGLLDGVRDDIEVQRGVVATGAGLLLLFVERCVQAPEESFFFNQPEES